MDTTENSQTVQHLWNIGQELATICPAASRYYIFNLQRFLTDDPELQTKNFKRHKFCEHCGTLWTPENHRVRIQPAPSKCQHIKKLLKLEESEPWKLNNRQKKKLKKFKETTSKIVYTCFNCKKTMKFEGLKRKDQNLQKRTLLYTLPLKLKPKKKKNASSLEAVKTKENEDSEIQLRGTENQLSESISKEMSDEKQPDLSTHPVPFLTPPSLRELNLPKKKYSLVETSEKKTNTQKKKKKSLLDQILKQEQEALKKKTTLSSFLVSL